MKDFSYSYLNEVTLFKQPPEKKFKLNLQNMLSISSYLLLS